YLQASAALAIVIALLPTPASARAVTCSGKTATIVGTAQADDLEGTAGPDVIFTGAGDDKVDSLAGGDLICGGGGDDTIDGGAGGDILLGGDGNDDLIGYGGPTFSEDGPDVLAGGNGSDFLSGLAGDDVLNGGANPSGGFGDTAIFYNRALVTLRGGSAAGVEGNDTLTGVENVFGSDDPDVIIGDDGVNIVTGFGGDDQIWGRGSNDFLDGGEGNDLIYGGEGTVDAVDYFFSAAGATVDLAAGTAQVSGETDQVEGVELVFGTPFGDVLRGDAAHNYFEGGLGDDTIDGRGNFDLASFQNGPAVNVDLTAGVASGQGSDSLAGIENVLGSEETDTITGDTKTNLLMGASGADVLSAGGGDDYVLADPSDSAAGGDGTYDLISFGLSGSGVSVDLIAGTMHSVADDGSITGFEAVKGSSFADRLIGDLAINYLTGGDGNDFLQGNEGDDRLDGEAGSDRIKGDDGDDGCRGEAEDGCESDARPPEHPLAAEALLAERQLGHRQLGHRQLGH
ncbi:MAG: hypothetical protein QOG16_1327, partial [Actinomycetota bacterium]|nr:hypothetical protein [Actinomycetota bacterium]